VAVNLTTLLTSISYCWRTRAMRCITANVLQTKVDAQCDKLATELSWQRLRRSTFSSYSELGPICQKLPILTYSTCIWRLRWGWPRLNFAEIFGSKKTRVSGLSYGAVCVIPRLAVSVEHRQTDRQTHHYGIYWASMASCGKKL